MRMLPAMRARSASSRRGRLPSSTRCPHPTTSVSAGSWQRARRRRARVVVLGAFAVLVGLVVAVLAGAFGGGDSETTAKPKAPTASTTRTSAAKTPVRTFAPATGSYRGPVPILMYHVVTAPPAGTRVSGAVDAARARSARRSRCCAREGYHGVTLGQVWKAWHGGPGLPAKPIVVSFDDGYLSQYTHAKPVAAGRRLARGAEPRGEEHRARAASPGARFAA